MLTQGIEVMRYIRASAGRSGISVVFEDTNQPRHDGKTIYLPRITTKTSDNELKQLMASVDHEVAHDRFSCFDVLKEKGVDGSGILMFVWNFLEDSRVNVIEAKEYRGFRENWDQCSSDLVEEILERAKKETSSSAKLTSSLLCWESHVSAAYFPTIELVANRFTPNEKITDVLNNYSARLVSCHQILDKRLGTEATYQLAVDILTDLGAKCKEELKEDKAPSPKAKGKKDGKAEKAEAETGDDKSDEEATERKEAEEDYKIIKVKLTKEDLEKFSLTMPQDGATMSKVGINFDPVDIKTDDWDLTDYKDFVVVNYPKKLGSDRYFDVSYKTQAFFINEYKSRVSDKLVSQENFAQQVRRLIQIRAKVQTQYGTKRGKLDQSRLSRICFDAPGFNERVFKTRIENKTLDVAITVLVDMSGSMGGDKAYYALASTVLLNEVCSTLNIPLEIIGFTDGYTSFSSIAPVMFVYKAFSDLKVSEDALIHDFSTSSHYMNGNPDGENILWTHDRLIKRKEKKKIMVVMSDGSPAASKSSWGLEGFTKKVIREIEDGKKVDIYGLGLCSDSVKHYYKAHDVVFIPQEIPSKLLSLIERKVLSHV
jgi:cobalamin biosynthesis protein CobT